MAALHVPGPNYSLSYLADKFIMQIMAESGKYDSLLLYDESQEHEADTECKESDTSPEKSKKTKIMTYVYIYIHICHSYMY